jgi:molybdate transport system ATP-binding protein
VLTEEALRRLYARPSIPPQGAALSAQTAGAGEALVEMRGVRVRYGGTEVLGGLDWVMRRGENWGILGPNGSGKTTLLALIYGDNLQAYSNDVRLFGRRRGTGEGLWEVRSRIGIVSPALQIGYRRALRVREVIESGFFDSIGLYHWPTQEQSRTAESWTRRLGLSDLAERPFDQLSYGERRMVLIARAMVKSPELLILDEPCEGLDPVNRRAVLALVDRVGFETDASVLYVSHVEDELPRCLTHTLRLGPRPPAASR